MWCTVVATGMCTTNLLADVHLDVPTESAIDWLDVVRLVLQRLVVVAADRAAPASPAAASPAAAAAPAVPAGPPTGGCWGRGVRSPFLPCRLGGCCCAVGLGVMSAALPRVPTAV